MAVAITAPSAGADAPVVAGPVPVSELLPWVAFGGLLLLLLLYFVGVEQGALSVFGGHFVHELVHDARHTLAFPCH